MNRVCGGGLWLALTVVIGCAGSEAEPAPAAPSRVAELLSIARVQDPASVGTLEQALRNGTPPEREVAAFGLGQLGVAWEPPPDAVRESAARALISALLMEREAAVRDRVIEALGKVGGKDAFETLVPLVDDDGAGLPAAERERAAVALALIARSSQGELVSPRARDAMSPTPPYASPARTGCSATAIRRPCPRSSPASATRIRTSAPRASRRSSRSAASRRCRPSRRSSRTPTIAWRPRPRAR
jgi:hypothetical protein